MYLTIEQIRERVRALIDDLTEVQANELVAELATCLAVGGTALEERMSDLVAEVTARCSEEDEHMPAIMAYGYLIHTRVLP
jgi:hypothetical protein